MPNVGNFNRPEGAPVLETPAKLTDSEVGRSGQVEKSGSGNSGSDLDACPSPCVATGCNLSFDGTEVKHCLLIRTIRDRGSSGEVGWAPAALARVCTRWRGMETIKLLSLSSFSSPKALFTGWETGNLTINSGKLVLNFESLECNSIPNPSTALELSAEVNCLLLFSEGSAGSTGVISSIWRGGKEDVLCCIVTKPGATVDEVERRLVIPLVFEGGVVVVVVMVVVVVGGCGEAAFFTAEKRERFFNRLTTGSDVDPGTFWLQEQSALTVGGEEGAIVEQVGAGTCKVLLDVDAAVCDWMGIAAWDSGDTDRIADAGVSPAFGWNPFGVVALLASFCHAFRSCLILRASDFSLVCFLILLTYLPSLLTYTIQPWWPSSPTIHRVSHTHTHTVTTETLFRLCIVVIAYL